MLVSISIALAVLALGETREVGSTSRPAPAASTEATEEARSRWTLFPLVTFAPETSLQGAAFAIYTFGGKSAAAAVSSEAPRSNVGLAAAYTLKNQFLVSVSPTLYLGQGQWRLGGTMFALWYPDVLYAAGPDSPAESEEQFTQRGFLGRFSLERRLIGHLSVGGQASGFHAKVTKVEPGKLLDQQLLTGSEGATGYGAGPLVVWDDRDREFASQRGGRHELSLMLYPRLAGADVSFGQLSADLRQYVSLWWPGHVVAFQLFSQLTWGDPPFQFMPTIGGDGRMRGFFASRFRDLHTAMAQIEYRVALWWRLGLAVFGSVGDVAHRVSDFSLGHFRTAEGGGVRVALDAKEGINLRVDVGRSSLGDINLYVALGEGF
jgi:hypothetical protein